MATPFCTADSRFCVYGDIAGQDIQFTIHSAASGWTGFGVGKSMQMADIYVAWKVPVTGQVLLSRRTSTGYALPQLAANQSCATVIPLKYPAPGWARLAYSFARPLDTVPQIGAASSFIYALSDVLPKTPTIASSGFRMHSEKGTIASLSIGEVVPGGPQPTPAGNQGPPTPVTPQVPPIPATSQAPPKTTLVKGAQNGTASCIDGSSFCLYGTPDGKNNVLFTVHAAGRGWAGVGLGNGMANADFYVGWKNSNGGYTVSRRTSIGQRMPILAPSQVATVIPLQVPAPAWAMLAFSFSRPIQADNVITANSPFIYAYSDSVPSTPDSMQSAFTIHQAYGSLPAVNFLSVKPVTAVGSAGAGAVPTDQPKPPKNAVVNGAQNVTASCIDGSTFCLYGTPDENKNVLFTVHAAGNGWAGVGLGNGMANADFYVGWKNSTGGYIVSRRTSTGQRMPNPASSQVANVIPLQVPAPAWATLAFSFSRPIQADNTINENSPFIYAYSDSAPSTPDSIQSSFTIHKDFGSLPAVNFLSAKPITAVGSSGSNQAFVSSSPEVYKQVLLAHGILFFIAWGLAPFAGIFIARYLKNRLGPVWFTLHQGLFVGVTGLLSVISFILIVLYKRPAHFDSTHTIIGLVVVIALIAQIALGYLINALFDPLRKSVPISDKIHWWLGRSLFVLGIANIYLGINEFDALGYMDGSYAPIMVVYTLVIAAGFAALVYGQFKMGQSHELVEIDVFPGLERTVRHSIQRRNSSQLLYEAERASDAF